MLLFQALGDGALFVKILQRGAEALPVGGRPRIPALKIGERLLHRRGGICKIAEQLLVVVAEALVARRARPLRAGGKDLRPVFGKPSDLLAERLLPLGARADPRGQVLFPALRRFDLIFDRAHPGKLPGKPGNLALEEAHLFGSRVDLPQAPLLLAGEFLGPEKHLLAGQEGVVLPPDLLFERAEAFDLLFDPFDLRPVLPPDSPLDLGEPLVHAREVFAEGVVLRLEFCHRSDAIAECLPLPPDVPLEIGNRLFVPPCKRGEFCLDLRAALAVLPDLPPLRGLRFEVQAVGERLLLGHRGRLGFQASYRSARGASPSSSACSRCRSAISPPSVSRHSLRSRSISAASTSLSRARCR